MGYSVFLHMIRTPNFFNIILLESELSYEILGNHNLKSDQFEKYDDNHSVDFRNLSLFLSLYDITQLNYGFLFFIHHKNNFICTLFVICFCHIHIYVLAKYVLAHKYLRIVLNSPIVSQLNTVLCTLIFHKYNLDLFWMNEQIIRTNYERSL